VKNVWYLIFQSFLEIEEQALRLGIDIVKEIHLLSVAKQCLLEPLPSDWYPWYLKNT